MQILLNFLSNAIKFTDQDKKINVKLEILEIQNISNMKDYQKHDILE